VLAVALGKASATCNFPFMKADIQPGSTTITLALGCKCPRCGVGGIYKPGAYLDVVEACPVCGLPLARNDSADGPAVFLIFVLGVLLVPAALLFEHLVHPPLWVHAVVWTIVALGLTLGSLRPLKAFVIGIQYRTRPDGWT
jgi:uncharacterized protein (DUF983 family)